MDSCFDPLSCAGNRVCRIAEDTVADADEIALQPPFFEESLSLVRLKHLPGTVNPARADAERVRGKHEILHDKAAVLDRRAGARAIDKHDDHDRRTVKRISVLPHDSGIHAREFISCRLILDGDHVRDLPIHPRRCIQPRVQNRGQLRFGDFFLLI